MSNIVSVAKQFSDKEKKLLTSTKDRTCHYCLQEKPKKEDLSRCKECKLVAYCGRACQKADWAFHKDNCWKARNKRIEYNADHKLLKSHLVQEGTSAKDVRIQEYARFYAWVSAHLVTISWAANCAARVQHGGASLRGMPLNRFMFTLVARPRITSDDNPSTAFVVSNASLGPLDMGRDAALCDKTGMTRKLEEFSTIWQGYAGQEWRARDRLLGVMPVLCSYAEAGTFRAAPVLEPLPHGAPARELPETHAGMSLWERWLPTIQTLVQRGHVLGPVDALEDIDTKMRVGTMRKAGEDWEWVQMSDEDARRFNYPEFAGDAFASGN